MAVTVLLVIALSSQLVFPSTALNCPSKPDSLPDLIFLGIPKSGDTECIAGTDGSQCDIYLRMSPNEEDDMFVDFYLEGSLKGWVAVGFSLDQYMGLTDVVGCIQSTNGSMGIINTWNPSTSRHNERDPSQDLMCSYDLQYQDKKLKCHFSRYRGIINEGYDYTLNESYYLILGHSDSQGPVNQEFPYHTVIPKASISKFNVFDYDAGNSSNGTTGLPSWSVNLKKAHGILMLIAWSILASTGVYISSWMKPALPKKRWFQCHRALMIATLPVAITAVICVFVANAHTGVIIDFHECSLLSAHFGLGVATIVLMLINPIVSLFRCNPKSPNRWIFNAIHGTVGALAIVIAHFAIGTGITFFNNECDLTKKSITVLIYVVWQIGFVLVYQIILNIVFTIIAFQSKGKERFYLSPSFIKFCLKYPSMDDEQYAIINDVDGLELDERYSKDYKLRAVMFAVYTTVNCIVVLALIILVAMK